MPAEWQKGLYRGILCDCRSEAEIFEESFLRESDQYNAIMVRLISDRIAEAFSVPSPEGKNGVLGWQQ